MKNEIFTEELRQEFYYPSNVFSKSNYLIQARYNYTLLCNQLLAISLLKAKKDGNSYSAKFSVMEVRNLLKKNYKDFYSHIKSSADKMTETKICIEDPDRGIFEYHQLIPTFRYDNGECEVFFNPQLNGIVGNLTSNFVVLNIKTLAELDSVNSFRLYETLKSKSYYPKNYKGEKNGKYIIEYSLAELRVMLNAIDINRKEIAELLKNKENIDYDNILKYATKLYEEEKDKDIPTKDKYKAPKWKEFKDFRKQCLEPAIEEINEKTELSVGYETIKINKSVKDIIFYVTDKSYETKSVEAEVKMFDTDELIDQVIDIIDEKISIKDIKRLLTESDNDVEKIKKAYTISKTQNVDNLVAFLISAIRNGYEEPVSKKKSGATDKFCDFEQRVYENDELEKIMGVI